MGLGPATPEFDHATAWYTRVSAILQVLNLAFNTVNNLCLQVWGAVWDINIFTVKRRGVKNNKQK